MFPYILTGSFDCVVTSPCGCACATLEGFVATSGAGRPGSAGAGMTRAAVLITGGAGCAEDVELAPRATSVWVYSSRVITPFDSSNSANSRSACDADEASLILAASWSVIIPFDCSSLTSG